MSLTPRAAQHLTGGEPFAGVGASVNDFWRFAMGDLRSNTTRGYLAEFLVARAVGSVQRRVEWDTWDVTAPDGTRIEVKTSAYLQAWDQRRLSRPSFVVAATRAWDETTQTRSPDARFHADAYVFCLHTATTHEEYDPLSVSQWSFHVAGRAAVEARGGAAMSVTTLATVATGPLAWADLREAVSAAGSATRSARGG